MTRSLPAVTAMAVCATASCLWNALAVSAAEGPDDSVGFSVRLIEPRGDSDVLVWDEQPPQSDDPVDYSVRLIGPGDFSGRLLSDEDVPGESPAATSTLLTHPPMPPLPTWGDGVPARSVTAVAEPAAASVTTCCPGETICCGSGSVWPCWLSTTFHAGTEAFQGPIDLDSLNGNFGYRMGLNVGVPLDESLGIGMQGGSSVGWSNFHGSQFTGSDSRFQSFTTVGVFRRKRTGCREGLDLGFAFDWLTDDYHASYNFTQWRFQASYHLDRFNELGAWFTIAESGDSALLGSAQVGVALEQFRPLDQQVFYWEHRWQEAVRTRGWIGQAEEPGEIVLGASAVAPLGDMVAVVSSVNYILPSARGGNPGRAEEFWNFGFGLAIYPRGNARRPGQDRYSPYLPIADNATMAVGRY